MKMHEVYLQMGDFPLLNVGFWGVISGVYVYLRPQDRAIEILKPHLEMQRCSRGPAYFLTDGYRWRQVGPKNPV